MANAFNLDKCDVLQITRTPLRSKYAIHGQVSKNVNSAKFLGEHLLNTQLGRPRQESDAEGTQQQPLILLKQKHQPFPSKHQGTMLFQTCKIIPGIRITDWSPAKKEASARSRQSNSELLVSPLGNTETNQQFYSDDEQKLNWTALEVRRNTPCLVIMLNTSGILDVCWKLRPS